jgi:hypothetical protein
MEKKQTAVQWFQEQIIKIVNKNCELSEAQIFLKALEMEKEQIINAYEDGHLMGLHKLENTGKQHYNETY